MPKNLRISLLGQIDIRYDDAPVENLTGKTLALLSYLVVTAGPHPRPALAGLLWGGMPEANARANLSKSLSTLRREFAPYLIITRQAVGFDRASDYWLDVQAFESLLQGLGPEQDQDIEALQQAVQLYQGDFLEQSYVRDALEFEQWVLTQRVRLRELALQALYALAAHFSGQGTAGRESAIAYTAHLLRLEPWREEAHREMMLLLAQSGQRGAALAQYGTCRRVLADELGVEPGPETTLLYEQIRDGELTAPPARPAQDGVPLVIADRPAVVARPPHNLPAQPTTFIGRKTELAEVKTQLISPACRLLTLIGPGGSGKTRLALEAAAAQLDANVNAFEHGVFFVSLAPLQSADAVVPAVADVLGLRFSDAASGAGRPPKRQLLEYLRQKSLLLILDNYEHLLAPPPVPSLGGDRRGGEHLVSEILETAPGIKILATSRTRLNVQGEHTCAVVGMDVPGDGHALQSARHVADAQGLRGEQPTHSDAVQLFVSSARRLNASFEPTGTALEDVVRICSQVQGMPLAIVLAAAWVQVLSLREIADEIRQSLDLLETDARDVPDRQRSMRATLDHSWHLLPEAERAVMRALSVFRGSFSRHAAQHVSGASLRELRTLLDKALVQIAPRSESQTGQFVPRSTAQTGQTISDGRYELHELLQQYAREKSDAAPDSSLAARERHCAYFAVALERWAADLKGARQAAALAEMRVDRENARAAWDWAVKQLDVACLGQSVEGLCHYFDLRGRWQVGSDACRAASEALSATHESTGLGQVGTAASNERIRVLGKVLTWQGVFSYHLGHTEIARQLLQQGLDLLAELAAAGTDSHADQAWALFFLSAVITHSGDDMEAARLREQSLALYRAAGDEWGTALLLSVLSLSARDSGAYDKAKRLAEESLALRRAMSNAWGTANALHILGWIVFARGEHDEAERLFREGVAIHQEIGHRGMDSVGVLNALSSTLVWLGRFCEALSVSQEALARCEDTGNRNQSPMAYWSLGKANLHLGHYADARSALQNGLNILQESRETKFLVATLATLGELALALGTHPDVCEVLEERITLAGEVESWRVNYELTNGLTVLAYTAHNLGEPVKAREYLNRALRPAIKTQNIFSLIHVLSTAALMFATSADSTECAKMQGVELYALLCRYPHVANSRWYEDVVGKQIAAAAATLPTDVVAKAQESGRTRDLWATAERLWEELDQAGENLTGHSSEG